LRECPIGFSRPIFLLEWEFFGLPRTPSLRFDVTPANGRGWIFATFSDVPPLTQLPLPPPASLVSMPHGQEWSFLYFSSPAFLDRFVFFSHVAFFFCFALFGFFFPGYLVIFFSFPGVLLCPPSPSPPPFEVKKVWFGVRFTIVRELSPPLVTFPPLYEPWTPVFWLTLLLKPLLDARFDPLTLNFCNSVPLNPRLPFFSLGFPPPSFLCFADRFLLHLFVFPFGDVNGPPCFFNTFLLGCAFPFFLSSVFPPCYFDWVTLPQLGSKPFFLLPFLFSFPPPPGG